MTEQKKKIEPAAIDAKCRAYQAKRVEADALDAEITPLKAELIALADEQGYVPANAEKSRRLDGVEMVATTTTGSSVEVKNDRVTELQLRLSKLKMPRLFSKLFARTIKHSLQKDASDTLKIAIAPLAAKTQAEVLSLFTGCFDVSTKAPSLVVEEVSVLRAREADKAAKAAAKAAKAAKPKKAAKKAGK
jgi:polyhydroxyalkanoate synthesis regulator phasin